jgi:hypothetical protein
MMTDWIIVCGGVLCALIDAVHGFLPQGDLVKSR